MGGIFEDPKLCPKVLLDFLMHMTFVCFTLLPQTSFTVSRQVGLFVPLFVGRRAG